MIFPQPSTELPFSGLWIAGGTVPGQTLQGLQSISITAGQRGITFPVPYFIFSLSFQPGSPLQNVQVRQNSPSPLIRVRAYVRVCAIIFLLCQKTKLACEKAINLNPCLVLLFCCAGL